MCRMDIMRRVELRLEGRECPGRRELEEIVISIADRVRLKVRSRELPPEADSIIADAAVKAVNRRYYEGISSESEGQTGSITTAFYESLLSEYEDELQGIRDMLAAEGKGSLPVARFV